MIFIAFDTYDKIYVTNYGSDTVSVINGSNNSWLKDIKVGERPIDIAFDAFSFNTQNG